MENEKETFEEIIGQANQILDFLKNLRSEVEKKQKESETLLSLNDNLKELSKGLELQIESIINLLDQISQLETEKIIKETQKISEELTNLSRKSESFNEMLGNFIKTNITEVKNFLNAFDRKLISLREFYRQNLHDIKDRIDLLREDSEQILEKLDTQKIWELTQKIFNKVVEEGEYLEISFEGFNKNLNNLRDELIEKIGKLFTEQILVFSQEIFSKVVDENKYLQNYLQNSFNELNAKLKDLSNSLENKYKSSLDELFNSLSEAFTSIKDSISKSIQQIIQSDLKNQKSLNEIQSLISSYYESTRSNFELLDGKFYDSILNLKNIISQSANQNHENLIKVNEDLQKKLDSISHKIQIFHDNFNEDKIAGHKTIKNLRKLIIISLLVSLSALLISLINFLR